MEILKLLRYVTENLEVGNIPYMLSGSMAMNIYTTPRVTRDIDIVIALLYNQIDTIAEIFNDGFYLSKEHIPEEPGDRECLMPLTSKAGKKLIS